MLVSSKVLVAAAEELRSDGSTHRALKNGVIVTPAQLDTAAKILRDAEPSICNGNVQERPGFIEPEQQDDDQQELIFVMGILPSATYRIDREGRVLEPAVSLLEHSNNEEGAR